MMWKIVLNLFRRLFQSFFQFGYDSLVALEEGKLENEGSKLEKGIRTVLILPEQVWADDCGMKRNVQECNENYAITKKKKNLESTNVHWLFCSFYNRW